MTILTGTFDVIPMPGRMWLRGKDIPALLDRASSPHTTMGPPNPTIGPWRLEIEGFRVSITLTLDSQTSTSEGAVARPVRTMTIAVTGDVDPNYERPGSAIGYPHIYHGRFSDVALEAANRMLSFFSYVARIPGLGPLESGSMPIPSWEDDQGTRTRGRFPTILFIPHESSIFDLSSEGELLTALRQGVTVPRLDLQLFMDAKTAFGRGQLRRATMETAIAVEIAAKSAVRTAWPELQALLRSSRARLDLYLDAIPQLVWGVGFKAEHGPDYALLKQLITARNTVAHSGKCEVRDDGGLREATRDDVAAWLRSAEVFLDWCAGRGGREEDLERSD